MKNSDITAPVISVIMITYRHEKYIRQAIEGVLMQDCDFVIELIIANDASPDTTDDIIQNIIDNHPRGSWIKYIRHQRNIGMMPNFVFALQKCKGNFIALCEGDDYWTDRLKLQKQVNFLEENPDYSFCGHKSFTLKNEVLTPIEIVTNEISLEVLLKKNMLNTATLIFRKSCIETSTAFLGNASAGDWLLQLVALRTGNGFVLDDYMSVYRVHLGGVWSSLSSDEMCEKGVIILQQAKLIFNDKKIDLLIDKAIKERRQNFNVMQISFIERIKIRVIKLLKSG